jgi:hypothetical protein
VFGNRMFGKNPRQPLWCDEDSQEIVNETEGNIIVNIDAEVCNDCQERFLEILRDIRGQCELLPWKQLLLLRTKEVSDTFRHW